MPSCLSRRSLPAFPLLCAMLLGAPAAAQQAAAPKADWKAVKVPEAWKNPPAGIDNLSWYRGFVKTPDAWKGKDLELFVEPTDAAHEVYFNGKKIGGAGEFPPFFRSGLGGADRFFVPGDAVRNGANVVAIRIYNQEGRTGFNLAAPVLFGEKEAVRMQGDWQFRPGDDAAWSKFEGDKPPEGTTLFARLDNAVDVAMSLKRIDDRQRARGATAPEHQVGRARPAVGQPVHPVSRPGGPQDGQPRQVPAVGL
jgi:hypothetical protein